MEASNLEQSVQLRCWRNLPCANIMDVHIIFTIKCVSIFGDNSVPLQHDTILGSYHICSTPVCGFFHHSEPYQTYAVQHFVDCHFGGVPHHGASTAGRCSEPVYQQLRAEQCTGRMVAMDGCFYLGIDVYRFVLHPTDIQPSRPYQRPAQGQRDEIAISGHPCGRASAKGICTRTA